MVFFFFDNQLGGRGLEGKGLRVVPSGEPTASGSVFLPHDLMELQTVRSPLRRLSQVKVRAKGRGWAR